MKAQEFLRRMEQGDDFGEPQPIDDVEDKSLKQLSDFTDNRPIVNPIRVRGKKNPQI